MFIEAKFKINFLTGNDTYLVSGTIKICISTKLIIIVKFSGVQNKMLVIEGSYVSLRIAIFGIASSLFCAKGRADLTRSLTTKTQFLVYHDL